MEKVLNIDAKLGIEEINKNKLLDINRLSPLDLTIRNQISIDTGIKFVNFTKFGVK